MSLCNDNFYSGAKLVHTIYANKESCSTNKAHAKSTLKSFVVVEISYDVFSRRGPTGPRFGPQNDKMKQ